MLFADPPRWEEDGRDWPNRAHSRFVRAGGMLWHVQRWGAGPRMLLLHGAGAATHSWRDLAPLLAERFELLAPDLPGHGFTQGARWRDSTLPGMARTVGALLEAEGFAPDFVLAHSAGAAVALRMALDGRIAPRRIIAVNAALRPFEGVRGLAFPAMAKALTLNPLAPRAFAFAAREPGAAERVIRGSGSEIDARGLALYARLLRRSGHVAGALEMMARWDLAPLARELPRLKAPLTLIVGERDRAVDPSESRRTAARVAEARVVALAGLGHLAHEERPGSVAEVAFEELTSSLPDG